MANGFSKIKGFRTGADLFNCSSCGKRTRRTVDFISSCPQCFEYDTVLNMLSDGHYETAEEKAVLEAKADKLGDIIAGRLK